MCATCTRKSALEESSLVGEYLLAYAPLHGVVGVVVVVGVHVVQ